jgi:integrase
MIMVKKEKIALTEEQIKDLINTIKKENKRYSERNLIIIKVWLSTGMRVSEIRNFQPNWIEKRNKSFFINVKENDKPYVFRPKYGSIRRIPINKKSHDMLKKFLAGRKLGYVFMPQSKKNYARFHDKYLIGMVNEYFEKTKEIGRKLGSHTFRRTFASQLYMSKPPVPVPKISQYLGHRNIATTFEYLKQIKTDDNTEILGADYLKKITNY